MWLVTDWVCRPILAGGVNKEDISMRGVAAFVWRAVLRELLDKNPNYIVLWETG